MAQNMKRSRLGLPSDFKVTSGVISQHEKLTKEVTDFLTELADRCEGLVIEKIEEELTATELRLHGRGLVILSGLSYFFLASNPVALCAGGMLIGYAVLAGSAAYEMRCSTTHAEKLKSIQTQLEAELKRYTESQEKVFRELDTYDVFDASKDFEDNLEAIKRLVRKAEKRGGENFVNIKAFFNKLELSYNKLETAQQEKLDSKDLLMTVEGLLAAGTNTTTNIDIPNLAADIATETISNAPWWDTFVYVNILANVWYGYQDLEEVRKLRKMREEFKKGGEARLNVIKNDKFQTELEMREIIRKIRDTILRDGY